MKRTLTVSTMSKPHIEAIGLADYKQKCLSCGATPTVVLMDPERKSLIYRSQLCGVCLWGEAVCADPNEWSSGAYHES